MDNIIPQDCISHPPLEDDGLGLHNSFLPPVPWALSPAVPTDFTVSSQASSGAPCQTMRNPSNRQRECPTARTSTFGATTKMSPAQIHEITWRGSETSNSSADSGSNRDSSMYSSRKNSNRIPSPGFEEHEYKRRKRERSLERNREAAYKCRKKKKEQAKRLESRCETVSQENSFLQSEVSRLRGQVLNLKDELLRHSRCRGEGIKRHLLRMAKQVPGKAETTLQISEDNVQSVEHTGGSMQDQEKVGFDDLVQLPASGDDSSAAA
ncbi:hypothetical protein AnigIFM59636_003250 [Aspergillus niger]|nr:hypothetical protein AnigIFM59636_003250 [Aspergillus niger]